MKRDEHFGAHAQDSTPAPAAQAGTYDLVIGIPTYRRPELLTHLLNTLMPELQGRRAYVIVADNDCGVEAPAVVARFQSQWPDMLCLPVQARGVAQVRNALVAAAQKICPQWQWLVMLDDDGSVTPGWLERLLEAGQHYQADVVAGPVDGQLPEGSNLFARNSLFAARRRWPTGPVPNLNGTQNLAIARKALSLVQEPLFRNEYGASGGEDYDMLRRFTKAGARFVWCDEAIVIEPTPAKLLTVPSLLNRYASTGAYMALIDRSYDGARTVWLRAFKGLAGASVRALLAGVRLRRDQFAQSSLGMAHYSGRLAGLMGLRTSRYVAPAKKAK